MTVNKCLAALRTVRGFPYFHPTCLCREPHLDRDCNTFSEFIFDHPCKTVVKNSKESPYNVYALPTCDYAARVCEQLPACRSTYDTFRSVCRVKDGRCRMENSEACLSAWTKLKQLPMFGCICPDDRQELCDVTFKIVHHNPCVDVYLASSAHTYTRTGVGGSSGLVMPPAVPPPPHSTTPYGSAYPFSYPRPNPQSPWGMHHNHHLSPHYEHVPPFLNAPPSPIFSAQTQNVLNVPLPSFRPVYNESRSFPVTVIPFDNTNYQESNTQIQTPLINGNSGSTPPNGSRAAVVLGSGLQQSSDPYASKTAMTSAGIPSLHSTCQTALNGCLKDLGCRRLLEPVFSACGSNCSRELCMENLQTFYRNVQTDWAMEVALCLCEKTNETEDECLVAQEKLHPSCARRPPGNFQPLCSTTARSCKDDIMCRHRLGFYLQGCAVDSDTHRCAASPAQCRRALLEILGTRLRNNCTCAIQDTRERFDCMDWQRILWFNPCVLESQTDYHRQIFQPMHPNVVLTTPFGAIRPFSTAEPMIEWPPLPKGGQSPHSTSPPKKNLYPKHTTRRPSLTTTTTTTALPPNYCVKELLDGKLDYIIETGSKRYYKVSDSCSQLCQCAIGKNLICNVLACIPSIPCKTADAVYNHASPAYQATRGECICYSESFICVRPNSTEDYSMEDGVYLLVGYSKKEEQLMNPHTQLTVMDTILPLRRLYLEKAAEINRTSCDLEFHSKIEENLILKATLQELDEFRDNMTISMLHKEKEACEPALKVVSDLINKKDPVVHQDVALSMFLVSDVHSKMGPLVGAAMSPSVSILKNLILCLIVCLGLVAS